MPLSWKLVIDSANSPAIADFWAAALEYEVEDPSALIEQLLAAGHIDAEAVVEHRGRKTFRGYAAIRHPEDPFDRTPKRPPDTQTRVWMRVAGTLPEDDHVHRSALTFVSDLTLLSAGLARLGGGWGGQFVGSSLDHAVWFHQPVAADEWFLYETDSPAASHGRALCFGQSWAADGTHVATVAQQGLIRSLKR